MGSPEAPPSMLTQQLGLGNRDVSRVDYRYIGHWQDGDSLSRLKNRGAEVVDWLRIFLENFHSLRG
jgi:hypothetical protein